MEQLPLPLELPAIFQDSYHLMNLDQVIYWNGKNIPCHITHFEKDGSQETFTLYFRQSEIDQDLAWFGSPACNYATMWEHDGEWYRLMFPCPEVLPF